MLEAKSLFFVLLRFYKKGLQALPQFQLLSDLGPNSVGSLWRGTSQVIPLCGMSRSGKGMSMLYSWVGYVIAASQYEQAYLPHHLGNWENPNYTKVCPPARPNVNTQPAL
jgi:hypothetical protein